MCYWAFGGLMGYSGGSVECRGRHWRYSTPCSERACLRRVFMVYLRNRFQRSI